MADLRLPRAARRQLSALQVARTSRLISSGAGVGCGMARTGESEKTSKLTAARMFLRTLMSYTQNSGSEFLFFV